MFVCYQICCLWRFLIIQSVDVYVTSQSHSCSIEQHFGASLLHVSILRARLSLIRWQYSFISHNCQYISLQLNSLPYPTTNPDMVWTITHFSQQCTLYLFTALVCTQTIYWLVFEENVLMTIAQLVLTSNTHMHTHTQHACTRTYTPTRHPHPHTHTHTHALTHTQT